MISAKLQEALASLTTRATPPAALRGVTPVQPSPKGTIGHLPSGGGQGIQSYAESSRSISLSSRPAGHNLAPLQLHDIRIRLHICTLHKH